MKITPSVITDHIEDFEIQIEVYPTLSKEKKEMFVQEVVDACFEEDSYVPHFKEDVFKIAILKYYTNVNLGMSSEERFVLVNQTNILQNVLCEIKNDYMISDLRNTIDNIIEFRKQEILSTKSQKLENALKQIWSLVETFNNIGEKFKSIDPDRIMDICEKISNKDESEIARSVLELVK